MVKLFKRHRTLFGFIWFGCLIAGLIMVTTRGETTQVIAKKPDYREAYEVFDRKCTGCHASVADPEKAGKTRDEWHLVVNVMHDYGVKLTTDESATIVNLLYKLRKGMEREPG